jgi:hypothetical protein
MENKFNQSDKEKLIDFLNIVASKAKFDMNTNEIIKYYHLLSYVQKELLPKIDENIMEVTRVIEDKENK